MSESVIVSHGGAGSNQFHLTEYRPMMGFLEFFSSPDGLWDRVTRGTRPSGRPTCVDANSEYVVVGTTDSNVYFYDRKKDVVLFYFFPKFNVRNKVVTCIKLVQSLDDVVAVGLSSGAIGIYALNRTRIPGQRRTLRTAYVLDVDFSPVTALAWSQNSLRLFSGYQSGAVYCTEINYEEMKVKSWYVLKENSSIVQLSYMYKVLVVSTLNRSIVVSNLDDSAQAQASVKQIGQTDRKKPLPLGATLVPGSLHSSKAVIYACRPGLRLWKADITGTVTMTSVFKEGVKEQSQKITTFDNIDPSKVVPDDLQFGVLLPYQINNRSYLVTYSGSSLYVLDPECGEVMAYHHELGEIQGCSVSGEDIFVVRSLAPTDPSGTADLSRTIRDRFVIQLSVQSLPEIDKSEYEEEDLIRIDKAGSTMSGTVIKLGVLGVQIGFLKAQSRLLKTSQSIGNKMKDSRLGGVKGNLAGMIKGVGSMIQGGQQTEGPPTACSNEDPEETKKNQSDQNMTPGENLGNYPLHRRRASLPISPTSESKSRGTGGGNSFRKLSTVEDSGVQLPDDRLDEEKFGLWRPQNSSSSSSSSSFREPRGPIFGELAGFASKLANFRNPLGTDSGGAGSSSDWSKSTAPYNPPRTFQNVEWGQGDDQNLIYSSTVKTIKRVKRRGSCVAAPDTRSLRSIDSSEGNMATFTSSGSRSNLNTQSSSSSDALGGISYGSRTRYYGHSSSTGDADNLVGSGLMGKHSQSCAEFGQLAESQSYMDFGDMEEVSRGSLGRGECVRGRSVGREDDSRKHHGQKLSGTSLTRGQKSSGSSLTRGQMSLGTSLTRSHTASEMNLTYSLPTNYGTSLTRGQTSSETNLTTSMGSERHTDSTRRVAQFFMPDCDISSNISASSGNILDHTSRASDSNLSTTAVTNPDGNESGLAGAVGGFPVSESTYRADNVAAQSSASCTDAEIQELLLLLDVAEKRLAETESPQSTRSLETPSAGAASVQTAPTVISSSSGSSCASSSSTGNNTIVSQDAAADLNTSSSSESSSSSCDSNVSVNTVVSKETTAAVNTSSSSCSSGSSSGSGNSNTNNSSSFISDNSKITITDSTAATVNITSSSSSSSSENREEIVNKDSTVAAVNSSVNSGSCDNSKIVSKDKTAATVNISSGSSSENISKIISKDTSAATVNTSSSSSSSSSSNMVSKDTTAATVDTSNGSVNNMITSKGDITATSSCDISKSVSNATSAITVNSSSGSKTVSKDTTAASSCDISKSVSNATIAITVNSSGSSSSILSQDVIRDVNMVDTNRNAAAARAAAGTVVTSGGTNTIQPVGATSRSDTETVKAKSVTNNTKISTHLPAETTKPDKNLSSGKVATKNPEKEITSSIKPVVEVTKKNEPVYDIDMDLLRSEKPLLLQHIRLPGETKPPSAFKQEPGSTVGGFLPDAGATLSRNSSTSSSATATDPEDLGWMPTGGARKPDHLSSIRRNSAAATNIEIPERLRLVGTGGIKKSATATSLADYGTWATDGAVVPRGTAKSSIYDENNSNNNNNASRGVFDNLLSESDEHEVGGGKDFEVTIEDIYSRYRPSESDLESSLAPSEYNDSSKTFFIRETNGELLEVEYAYRDSDDRACVSDDWLELTARTEVQALSVSRSRAWVVDDRKRLYTTSLAGPVPVWNTVRNGEKAQLIAVAPSGNVVCKIEGCNASVTRDPYRRSGFAHWGPLKTDVMHMALDDSALWFVNVDGEVIYRHYSLSEDEYQISSCKVDRSGRHRIRFTKPFITLAPQKHGQELIKAVEVKVLEGVVWILGSRRLLYARGGISETEPTGTNWIPVSLNGLTGANVGSFDLGERSFAWIYDSVGCLWYMSGVTSQRPQGTGIWWQVSLPKDLMQERGVWAFRKEGEQTSNYRNWDYVRAKDGQITAMANGVWLSIKPESLLRVNPCNDYTYGYRWQRVVEAGKLTPSNWKELAVIKNPALARGGVWLSDREGRLCCFVARPRIRSWSLKVVNKIPASESMPGSRLDRQALDRYSDKVEVHMRVVKMPDESKYMASMSMGPANVLWCVTSKGNAFIRTAVTEDNLAGDSWEPVDMAQLGDRSMVYVSVGVMSVWAIHSYGNIYMRWGVYPPPPGSLSPVWISVDHPSKSMSTPKGRRGSIIPSYSELQKKFGSSSSSSGLNNRPWDEQPKRITKLAVSPDDDMVWAIDNDLRIYARAGIRCPEQMVGTHWVKVEGCIAQAITITTKAVYVAKFSGEVMVRVGISRENPAGVKWIQVPGCLSNLSGEGDDLWGLDYHGRLFRRLVDRIDKRSEDDEPVSGLIAAAVLARETAGEDWVVV